MGLVERFVAATLGQRVFVLLCLVALFFTGIVALRDLPIEAFPDLTNNQVVVITEAPSLAAPEVEQRISYPIETALMGVPDTEGVRSISKFGLSIVTVVFDDAVPIYFARQLVTERIADVRSRIPEGLEPVLGPVATAFRRGLPVRRHRRGRGPHDGEDDARLGHPRASAVGVRGERGELVGRPHQAVPGGCGSAAAGEVRAGPRRRAAGRRRS